MAQSYCPSPKTKQYQMLDKHTYTKKKQKRTKKKSKPGRLSPLETHSQHKLVWTLLQEIKTAV